MKIFSLMMLLTILLGCSRIKEPSLNQNNKCTMTDFEIICGQGSLIKKPEFFQFPKNSLSIEFTMIGSNAKIGSPLNRSILKCEKEDGFCTDFQAINLVKEDGTILGPQVFIAVWEIMSWSNDEIILISKSRCSKSIMNIDLNNEKITSIRTANDPLPTGCHKLQPETFITESAS